MRNLDDCLEKTRKIKEIEEQIEELKSRVMSPKNQVITGMPRGGGGGNQSESYIVKLERLEVRKKKTEEERNELWHKITAALCEKSVKATYIQLLQYRFYYGMQWKKCCKLMCEKYPEGHWNMNKVFRVYRQIIRKFS